MGVVMPRTQHPTTTFWISEDVIEEWGSRDLTGDPGAPVMYSDIAIVTIVTLKSLFNLGGRQATGFVSSIFGMLGVELPVPDHSTLSSDTQGS
jgi:Transposase DDE domain